MGEGGELFDLVMLMGIVENPERPIAKKLYNLFESYDGVLQEPITPATSSDSIKISPGLRRIITLEENARKFWANGSGEIVTHIVYDFGLAEVPFIGTTQAALAMYLEGITESTVSGISNKETYSGGKPSRHIMRSVLHENGSATLEGLPNSPLMSAK